MCSVLGIIGHLDNFRMSFNVLGKNTHLFRHINDEHDYHIFQFNVNGGRKLETYIP